MGTAADRQVSACDGDRKAAAIDALGAEIVATGNIGCATQLAGATAAPVAHTVELLDWATGGPRPVLQISI